MKSVRETHLGHVEQIDLAGLDGLCEHRQVAVTSQRKRRGAVHDEMRKCVRLYLFPGKGYVSDAAGLQRRVTACGRRWKNMRRNGSQPPHGPRSCPMQLANMTSATVSQENQPAYLFSAY